MPIVRIRLRIEDDLLRELESRARQEGVTLSELVNLTLRRSLAAPKRSLRPFRLKTRDLGQPSFDVTRANAVAGVLDDLVILRKLST